MNTFPTQYKAVAQGGSSWLVIQFYNRPGMGPCHTGYFDVVAPSADAAVAQVIGQR